MSPILQMMDRACRSSTAAPMPRMKYPDPCAVWWASYTPDRFCPRLSACGAQGESDPEAVEGSGSSLHLDGSLGFFSCSPAPPPLTCIWSGYTVPPSPQGGCSDAPQLCRILLQHWSQAEVSRTVLTASAPEVPAPGPLLCLAPTLGPILVPNPNTSPLLLTFALQPALPKRRPGLREESCSRPQNQWCQDLVP